jgi:ABC-type Fe3+-citrate transport system substrate-binding protein
MKTIKFTSSWKQLVLVVSLLLVVISTTSCAHKTAFKTSSVIPAARGEVKVKKDNNNNYKIEMELSYLAEPERLQPPKKTYVVWLVGEDRNAPINIGRIESNKKLKVKFETVSSIKPKRIFISAEDDYATQFPSYTIVLETNDL